MDIGEVEAIILAKQTNADWLLIDEKKGRQKAEELGIKIVGLMGLLVKGKQKGLINAVRPEIEKLTEKAEFRLSQSLIDLVLKEVDEK